MMIRRGRLTLFLLLIIFCTTCTTGCSWFYIVEMERTPTPTEITTPVTPPSSLISTGSPDNLTGAPPTPTFAPGVPRVHSVAFTTNPDSGMGGTVFPQGTKEVWAVMDYFGMQDGMIFRRVWYKNGEVWIDRDDPWDFAKYGAEGKLKDISVYSLDEGLEPAHYELEVYIDGVNQFVSNGEQREYFDIVKGPTGTRVFTSPAGTQTILLELPGTLRLVGELCDEETLAEHVEVEDVSWFPDNRHVLYVVVDRSEQFAPPSTIGLKWELWIVDTVDKQPYRITDGTQNFHEPVVSPSGETIAVAAGTGYGDAGMIDYGLAFIKMSFDYKLDGVFRAQDFDGIPADSLGSVYPSGGPNYLKLGEWTGPTAFDAPMQATFVAEGFNPGMYRFDLATLTATRTGDLPPQ